MLSKLQQYILEECLTRGGSVGRRIFDNAQQGQHTKKVITQSIERLIGRGLLIGYGIKTKAKLFIDKVKITAAGRRQVQQLRDSRQTKLPLHKILRIATRKDANVSSKNRKISGPVGTVT